MKISTYPISYNLPAKKISFSNNDPVPRDWVPSQTPEPKPKGGFWKGLFSKKDEKLKLKQ